MTILVIVLRQFSRAGELGRASIRSGPVDLVARFRALTEDRYADKLSIADFASQLGVSVAELRAACLSTTGQALPNLVHERVLIEAKRNLVYSAHDIAQIAYALGFDDPAYFSRFFARAVDAPPAQYCQSKVMRSLMV